MSDVLIAGPESATQLISARRYDFVPGFNPAVAAGSIPLILPEDILLRIFFFGTLSDLVDEFTIPAPGQIRNLGGTDTSGNALLVEWLDRHQQTIRRPLPAWLPTSENSWRAGLIPEDIRFSSGPAVGAGFPSSLRAFAGIGGLSGPPFGLAATSATTAKGEAGVLPRGLNGYNTLWTKQADGFPGDPFGTTLRFAFGGAALAQPYVVAAVARDRTPVGVGNHSFYSLGANLAQISGAFGGEFTFGTGPYLTSVAVAAPNQWLIMVFILNGLTSECWRNGELVVSGDAGGSSLSGSATISAFGATTAGAGSGNWEIAELQFWDVADAIEAARIRDLYTYYASTKYALPLVVPAAIGV